MSDPVTAAGTDPGADGLVARLGLRRDDFALDIALEVPPGGVLALLGPNGAGKTTTLRLLAGLLALDHGTIGLDGQLLDDPGTGRWVPPERRPLGMVFQDHLLFGHLDARDNVAFGLRARGVPRRVARARADHWLERLGLGTQARARPAALSGGQAQRVALARALAVEPRLLLLDEPLAALDASTRLQVRGDLRRHLADFPGTTVLVTHDPLEAMVLSDRMAVVEEGRVVQQGTPAAVARSPRTDYVARLVGLNLYRGRARGGRVELEGGGTLATAERRDGPVFVAFPPSAVSLRRRRPAGSQRNVWPGRVTGLEQHGETARVSLAGSPPVLADVTAEAVADLGLGGPDQVWASVRATEVRCYPARDRP